MSMDEKEELINGYNQLALGDKRRELGQEIAELSVVTGKLIADIVPDYKIKEAREFTNLFEEDTTENEYLTGLYQDVIELEEIIGTYYDIVTEMYCKDNSSTDANTNL